MMGSIVMPAIMLLLLVVGLLQYRRFRRGDVQKKRYARTLLIFIIIFSVFILPILATLHLETRYYTSKVEYRFASVLSPLFNAPFDVVSLDSVTKVNIITYDPADYGGWGMKGNEHTIACNAVGNKGVLFTFKRGKQLLIGTESPDTLQRLLPTCYPF